MKNYITHDSAKKSTDQRLATSKLQQINSIVPAQSYEAL